MDGEREVAIPDGPHLGAREKSTHQRRRVRGLGFIPCMLATHIHTAIVPDAGNTQIRWPEGG